MTILFQPCFVDVVYANVNIYARRLNNKTHEKLNLTTSLHMYWAYNLLDIEARLQIVMIIFRHFIQILLRCLLCQENNLNRKEKN